MADLYDKNEDGTYVGLDFTKFPAEVDSWQDSQDVSSASLSYANAYKEALASGNYKLAQQIILGNPTLSKMRISAIDINQIKHSIMAIERLFKEDIEEYIIKTASEITNVDSTLSIRGAPADAAATGTSIKEVKKMIEDGTTHNHDASYLKLSGGTINGSLTVIGDITGNKVFGAVYNDYAEFFPRGEATEPGDIIALDTKNDQEKYCKAIEGDSRVVGVHSDEFGHLIGGNVPSDPSAYYEENIQSYIPVGLIGRVRTKLIGKVQKGDYIVPSSTPGVGRAFKDGDDMNSVIGYAVESDNRMDVRRLRIKLKG